MKKLFCLLLSLAMLIPLSACAEPDEPVAATETGTETAAPVESETENRDFVCDLPASLRFDGETAHIIHLEKIDVRDELVAEKLGLSQLSDAVYERNRVTEEALGITLDMIAEQSAVHDAVARDITAGLREYDIAVNCTYMSVIPAVNGQYVNLTPLENINLSKHYWTQGYNDVATFTTEGKQFLASGSIAISMYRLMFFTLYNKQLFADKHLTDPYETVMNGGWTLDYQNSLIQDCYADANGNGKRDEDDSYGFVSGTWISVDPYVVAADIHLITKDPETADLMYNKDAAARLPDLGDKVRALYNNDAAYVCEGMARDDVNKNDIIGVFTRGRSLMSTVVFWHLEHNIADLAGMNYGIAPIPKFSEAQSAYYSYVQDQVSSFGISAAISDTDRQELLAAVLETMCMHSHRIIRPAYYDTALSYRYLQDPDSKVVLDLMFDSMQLDFANTCGNVVEACVMRDQLRSILTSSKGTVASKTKTWEKVVSRALDTVNKKVNRS